MVLFEKFKIVSSASSIVKNIVTLSSSRFPVKLIHCIAFASASRFRYFAKSILINLNNIFQIRKILQTPSV